MKVKNMEFQLISEMRASKTRVPCLCPLPLLKQSSVRATAERQTFPNAVTLKLSMSFNNFSEFMGFDNLNLDLLNGMALL